MKIFKTVQQVRRLGHVFFFRGGEARTPIWNFGVRFRKPSPIFGYEGSFLDKKKSRFLSFSAVFGKIKLVDGEW